MLTSTELIQQYLQLFNKHNGPFENKIQWLHNFLGNLFKLTIDINTIIENPFSKFQQNIENGDI